MNIYKKLENERKYNFFKIIIPLIIMGVAGYFLYVLIVQEFFIGWEIYFATGCYILTLFFLLVIDVGIMKRIYYDIYIKDNKLKIRDGFFSRSISIPLDRLYYINSIKLDNSGGYDSIFITDKKINHSKVNAVSDDILSDKEEHLMAVNDLKDRYPDKSFFYYRVHHGGYRFLYYFYMIYKSCEKCRFSDVSMELVKKYAEGK